MQSKELDRNLGVKPIKIDLHNGLNPCFGNHQQCSPDICSTTKGRPVVLENLPVQEPAAQSHLEDEVEPEENDEPACKSYL